MDDIGMLIDQSNAVHRDRRMKAYSDAELVAYMRSMQEAQDATPDTKREILALYDRHEIEACQAEMLRRGLVKPLPPARPGWRTIPTVEVID
jgi:hypothetical protein